MARLSPCFPPSPTGRPCIGNSLLGIPENPFRHFAGFDGIYIPLPAFWSEQGKTDIPSPQTGLPVETLPIIRNTVQIRNSARYCDSR